MSSLLRLQKPVRSTPSGLSHVAPITLDQPVPRVRTSCSVKVISHWPLGIVWDTAEHLIPNSEHVSGQESSTSCLQNYNLLPVQAFLHEQGFQE